MKTRREIETLKAGWLRDPCWDIETTETFEAHRDELLAFRQATEAGWKAEREAREAALLLLAEDQDNAAWRVLTGRDQA